MSRHFHSRRPVKAVAVAAVTALSATLLEVAPTAGAVPAPAYDAHLTRAPYLTDLVDRHVTVNWATDRSTSSASVVYGLVGADGTCTPGTTAPATRQTIAVGAVYEYQWKTGLELPAFGRYCYRVLLGSTDLLGTRPSPTFVTQVPFGSTQTFTFAVFGDWGQVDANGQNPDQAELMVQLAASGARFAVSVGDNGYPNGSQANYGDLQQVGPDTSAIFGPGFWAVPGASMPLFAAPGNHGLAGLAHTDIATWTEDRTVSASGGRYQNDVYCCVGGSNPANYGSEWYAFSAGNARFYILDSAWGDTNTGTANAYANDAAAHFNAGDPEYDWLVRDLQTHPTQLKFVFSHYPLYSDNVSQPSDAYLQGPPGLEGLLARYGVQIVFNGHAHIYERNQPSAAGMPVTYVTGGGGATPEPIGPCHAFDRYGLGWSPTRLTGSACGMARPPGSSAQVVHFLKITVAGTAVTVTPTDSTGRTFDVQTYRFKVPTDTYIDAAPPAGTAATTATFAFHSSGSPASFTCRLDGGATTRCSSPVTYTGLLSGVHAFSVAGTYQTSADPTPATASWTVDTTPPGPPGGLSATSPSPYEVDLSWSAATDDTGVVGYDLYRDGSLYQSLGPITSYQDAVFGGSTHGYALEARDVAGNTSLPGDAVQVNTAPPNPPSFADGFESGDLRAWGSSAGLTVETTTVGTGLYAAEGNSAGGGTYAKKSLPSTYLDAYARVRFDILSQPDQVNLLRLRDAGGASIGYLYVDPSGQLGYHSDILGANTASQQFPAAGWHALELHLAVGPGAGEVGVWLDGRPVPGLIMQGVDTGSAPVAGLQIGEVQSGRAYDVVFDDAAFGAARLGPAPDSTPPTAPTGVSVSAQPPSSVRVSWNRSVDDVALAGYDVLRNGSRLASVGDVTAWTDSTVVPGTEYSYTVEARDTSGNSSPPSVAAAFTTPAAGEPLFADGFESGNLSAWTSAAGLVVQSADTEIGSYAAEGNPSQGAAWAKAVLPSGYSDVYARVGFEVKAQASQLTVLRLRDTPSGRGAYLYLTPSGRLGFRSDALSGGSTSSVAPGPGWHDLELHLDISTGTVQVWLDGAAVGDLTLAGVDLGTAPMSVMQIGDTASGSWDVVFDNLAFGTARIGPR